MPGPSQTNTQKGNVVKYCVSAVVKGTLVQLVDQVGVAGIQVPASDGLRCDFVACEDGAIGDYISVEPLNSNQSIRVLANGTIAGATLVQVEATTGKVKVNAGSTGIYNVGVTEEDTVVNQLVLIRPHIWKQ